MLLSALLNIIISFKFFPNNSIVCHSSQVFLICSVTRSEDSFMSSESTFWQRASFSTLTRWCTTIGCGGATSKYISTFKLRKRKGVSIKEPDLRDRYQLLSGSDIYHEAFVCLSYSRQFKERLSLIRLISHGICQHTHAHSNTLRHTHSH